MEAAPAVPSRESYRQPIAAPAQPGGITLPPGTRIAVPQGPGRTIETSPRYGRQISSKSEVLPDKSTRTTVVGGIIVHVPGSGGVPEIEFAADNAVIWKKSKTDEPEARDEIEVYMSGNVIVRMSPKATGGQLVFEQTMRADQVYYDVTKSRAVALAAGLELASGKVPDGIHLTGKEVRRLDEENWEVLHGSVFSTKLPADPGLRFDSTRATLRQTPGTRENIFGIPYRNFEGEIVPGTEQILTARNTITRVNGVPVFYWPYLRTDLNEPLGPLIGLGGGQDRIFGTQIYTTWDMFKVLALQPPPGMSWKLHLDYLSDRGPAAGTDFYYRVTSLVDPIRPPGQGTVRLYGINDGGVDQIGGYRGPPVDHPATRGRALWQHQQDIIEGMYVQAQLSYLSDQNFLEQYYKQEFDYGPSQDTFAYLTYQQENLWSSALISPRLGQDWMTRSQWLPRVDGAMTGQSLADLFVYNARANAGYARLSPATVNPLPVLTTDQADNTARVNLNQDISLPLDLGIMKVVPYGTLDLTYYSNDLQGNDVGRIYGGGGVRGSMPFSRLYESASSDLFNVHGLYHKITLSSNYYYAQTNVHYWQLPLLDRLDDDNTDYTYRYSRPAQPSMVPGPAGIALATSPIFNQQLYAIRRLVDDRVDTLDSMQVLQMDLRQRLQTKRGYPGLEHTVDWLTFDISGSYFPQANRDNFGKSFAFLEYYGQWNVGDRTSVLSSGWIDPFDFGARYWNLGVSLDRPDRTNIYFGYRQTDPLNSKAVTASIGYQLSRRYYTSIGASYDFGIQQALTNSLSFTRTGSDVTITVGFTYNALVNNFGFNFLIVPNIVQAIAPGLFGGPASAMQRR